MFRRTAVLSAQEVAFDEPALTWPPPAANDPVVLSPEPFGGVLRPSPTLSRTSRRGFWGGIAGAAAAMAMITAAALLAVGRFGGPAPSVVASAITPEPVKLNVASAIELAEGIRALRSQMQAVQAPVSTVTQVSISSADKAAAVEQGVIARSNTAAPPLSPDIPAAEPASTRRGPAAEDVSALLDRAKRLIAVGDIAAARRLAEYAAAGDDGHALFALAETFDPRQLARWHVRGVRADAEKARVLYRRALEHGIPSAGERLSTLP